MSQSQPSGTSLPNATSLFELSDDQREVLDTADIYARNELYPLARAMDDEESWPDAPFRKLGQDGYFGITTPPELGGMGSDLFTSGLVLQAFSRWNHALGLSWVAHEEHHQVKFAAGDGDRASIGVQTPTLDVQRKRATDQGVRER